ncbi:hypothetical protein NE237_009046 [Protea cynaroides]|uniref:GATA-type domain-containing protein n=1 Tax=Protea cynaroides TaxID=273540 RepID=A0A9Q0KX18_9MAGN|nr:hypothetical protein NE237_009046 [Protea cynaroides]
MMIGSGFFMDDLGNDLCGDFFDHIDDLLDFPMEDVEGGGGCGFGVGGEYDSFQGAWPPPPTDAFPTSITALPDKNGDNTCGELPTELSVPHEDIAQLEWLSNFVEDSFSAGSITMENVDSCTNINPTTTTTNSSSSSSKKEDEDNKDSHRFQTSSPVSVLESSSSCSGGSGSTNSSGFRTMPALSPETFVPGRARSKRPRPATFNPRPIISLISPTSSITDANPFSPSESASEFENYADSHPVKRIHLKPITATDAPPLKRKKKKKLVPLPPPSSATDQQHPQPAASVRKCLHCEITKTPQWRAGPLGPKTLCNACGVRFKSGRLFPEYRPAASPTFMASLHSNSHKKVLEMRVKATPNSSLISNVSTETPELIPNNNPLLHYI